MVDRWIEGNLQKSQFDLINVNVGLFVIKKKRWINTMQKWMVGPSCSSHLF